MFIGVFTVAIVATSFLRRFLVTRAKGNPFLAIAAMVGTVYVILVPLADAEAFRPKMEVEIAPIFVALSSLGIAWYCTVDSGIGPDPNLPILKNCDTDTVVNPSEIPDRL